MKFRIRAILWVFALLASALATFGPWGVLWTMLIVSFWAVMFRLLRMTFLQWLIVTVVAASFAVFLQSFDSNTRPNTVRQNTCMNRIKALALAALAYQSAHGNLPQDIVDVDGKPLLSWRVRILPYLDEQELFDMIHLDEAWDGPNNRKLWERIPEVYRCPGCEFANQMGTVSCLPTAANYFAVTGSKTVWAESNQADWKELATRQQRLEDDNTFRLEPPKIMLVETVIPTNCWMEPLDLSVEDALTVFRTNKRHGHLGTIERFIEYSSVALHTQVANIGGQAEMIYNDISREEAVQRLIVGDPMPIDWNQIEPQHAGDTKWVILKYRWSRIYSFTCFLLLSVLPLGRVLPLRTQR